jgi:hypothetical protein
LIADATRFFGRRFGRGGAVGTEAQFLGDELRPQSELLALDARP